jgi:hypothetical protein
MKTATTKMQMTKRVVGHKSIWQRSFLPLRAAGEVF